MSTRKIQDAINSANAMFIDKDGEQYYIKTKNEPDYETIRNAVGLKPIATYGKKRDLM